MQRVYDIDQVVTGSLKGFSNKLARSGFTRDLQFAMIPAIMVSIMILQMVESSGTNVFGLLYLLGGWLICYLIHQGLKRFLAYLHRILDLEESNNPHKYYSSGYAAWSVTFLTIGLTGISMIHLAPDLHNAVIAAEGMTGMYAVLFFLNRIENTKWEKRKHTAEKSQTTERLAHVMQ